MKKVISYVMMICMIAGMCFPASAAEQLPFPSWVRWNTSESVIAEWEIIEGAEGVYRVEIYKDGKLFSNIRHRGNVRGRDSAYRRIEESGTYTFRVRALGDNMQTVDSEWSELSSPYTYKRPNRAFGKVQNLRWSATEEGTAEWDMPLGVSTENEAFLEYDVTVYADNKPEITHHGIRTNRLDLREDMNEDVTHSFSVKAISKDIEHIAHGPEVMSEDYIDVPSINEEVLDELQTLYLQMSDELASPSDAEDALEEMDIKKLAIAVQSSEENLEALQYVEEEYLAQTGKSVEKVIDDSIGISVEDIDIVGAGLNIASDSNAVQVNVKKPNKEAEVNSQLYKNVVQFDIGLTNAIPSLRAPVTIIMPIPDNIVPERLMILHYHRDGSYETIWPVITEDGRAKFTVIDFSIFAFAEQVETDEPDEPDDTDKPDIDIGTSSNDSDDGYFDNPGKWIRNDVGWCYQNGDGSWQTNGWAQLEWNGKDYWYLFDENGYLKSGWQEWNGKRYYLHPISDGMFGYMYTGQNMIDGIWYDFGVDGALVANGVW